MSTIRKYKRKIAPIIHLNARRATHNAINFYSGFLDGNGVPVTSAVFGPDGGKPSGSQLAELKAEAVFMGESFKSFRGRTNDLQGAVFIIGEGYAHNDKPQSEQPEQPERLESVSLIGTSPADWDMRVTSTNPDKEIRSKYLLRCSGGHIIRAAFREELLIDDECTQYPIRAHEGLPQLARILASRS